MADKLESNLKKRAVKYSQLVLDPNNPRFTTTKKARIAEEHYFDQDKDGVTIAKLKPTSTDHYKIGELVSSIRQNGWLPVDSIFVRKLKSNGKYFLVLEGNRRVAAIREIMKDPEFDPARKSELETIEVMEVLDKESDIELQKKITYLLGVRHHGSLKKWTPFAQAHNILSRYLEVSKQTPSSFSWDPSAGKKVADTLSIPIREVQERLQVYRAMVQIGDSEGAKLKNGVSGVIDRYYSVCATPLTSPGKKLVNYIKQDPTTFLLSEESVGRMNKLCHFSEPSRAGAPIVNPREWGYLDQVLAVEPIEKSAEMLQEVEEQKIPPSRAWAPYAATIAKITWEKWLFNVNSILKTVTISDDFKSLKAQQTTQRLVTLIEQLETKNLH